jgi:hypothetical protein
MAAPATYIKRDGYSSIIPKGSIIYRGQTDAFQLVDGTAFLARNVISDNSPTFFGLEEEVIVNNYGLTTALSVSDDIVLLNIDSPEAYNYIASLMQQHDPEALEALTKSYPVNADGQIMRDSVKKNDMKVVEFICKYTEYEGYIQPMMPKPEGGMMHSEIAVCQTSAMSKIHQSGKQKALNPDYLHQGEFDKYRMRMLDQKSKEKRKLGRVPQTYQPPAPRKKIPFNIDDSLKDSGEDMLLPPPKFPRFG